MNKKPINTSLTKEFFLLLKTIEKTTKNQAKIKSYNPEDISSFIVEICPKKGLYQFAKFLFQIQLVSYPREFPNVICLSDIYHPNIEHSESYHNVCLNLFDNWNRSFGLIDVIQGLIFLLYQPNLSDPISSFFNSKNTSDEIFRRNVYTSLHGGTVDGIDFLPNPGISEYHFREQNHSKDDDIEKPTDVEENNEQKPEIVDIYSTQMTNNNAAQLSHISVDSHDQIDESIIEKDNGPMTPYSECQSEDEANDLSIKELLGSSPNAFYSDLICSRYSQNERGQTSDSEYDSSCDIYDAMIIGDHNYFGVVSPSSSYVSASCIYGDEMYCVWRMPGDDLESEEEEIECQYITLPNNHNDPSYVFLRRWVDLRKNLNITAEPLRPITTIVLTDIINPFRDLLSTFLWCSEEPNELNGRHYYNKAVYRIQRNDRLLHWMVWGQNVSRWVLNRTSRLPILDWGCDSVLWYSLFLGLSYKIRERLCHVYNCQVDTAEHDCLFV